MCEKYAVVGSIDVGQRSLTVIREKNTTTLTDEKILVASKQMVLGARAALWAAIDHLRRYPQLGGNMKGVVDVLAQLCFGYEAGEFARALNDIDTMRRIFVRTWNGITGNQTVVIEELSAIQAAGTTFMVKDQKEIDRTLNEGNPAALTKVREADREAGQSHLRLRGKQKEIKKATFQTTLPSKASPVYWLAGGISIDWKTLEGRSVEYPSAILVYIHELTHKHAGTSDRFYIRHLKLLDDLSFSVSHAKVKLPVKENPPTQRWKKAEKEEYLPIEKTPNQSLKNADSYAWFAYALSQKVPYGYEEPVRVVDPRAYCE
jgi:hypothetical protein